MKWVTHAREMCNAWVAPSPYLPPIRAVSPVLAWSGVLGLFLCGFGTGLVGVLQSWVGGESSQNDWVLAHRGAESLGTTVLLVVVTVAVVRWLSGVDVTAGGRGLPRLRRAWRGVAVAVVSQMSFFISAALMALAAWLIFGEAPGFPFPTDPSAQVFTMMDALEAGFREEFLFCLAIPLLLVASGHSVLLAATCSAVL